MHNFFIVCIPPSADITHQGRGEGLHFLPLFIAQRGKGAERRSIGRQAFGEEKKVRAGGREGKGERCRLTYFESRGGIVVFNGHHANSLFLVCITSHFAVSLCWLCATPRLVLTSCELKTLLAFRLQYHMLSRSCSLIYSQNPLFQLKQGG